jgi:hypothetical protein
MYVPEKVSEMFWYTPQTPKVQLEVTFKEKVSETFRYVPQTAKAQPAVTFKDGIVTSKNHT